MENQKITTVCIPAYNDNETVKSALNGLLSNLNKYNRTPRIMVIDDCSEQKYTDKNREITSGFIDKYKGKIEFIDREDRKKYAIKISKEKNIPEDVCIYAFCGDKNSAYTVGSSQNYLLANTKGELIISIDYDVIFNLLKPDDSEPSFTIENPFETWFLNKDQKVPDLFKPIEIDILSIHEKALGKKVSDILYEKTFPDYICNNTILDTFMGIYGDSPMESNTPLMLLPQVFNKIGNITSDEYKNIKNTRRIVWSTMSETIYQGIMCICTVMGIDNRNTTPPFMSNGRGHELVYGTLRWKAFVDKVSYFSPIIIGHERPRGSRPVGNNSVYELTKMDRVISYIISNMRIDNIDPIANINEIGRNLIDITDQPTKLFELLMQDYCYKILKSISNYSLHLSNTNTQIAEAWRKDMEELSKSVTDPDIDNFMSDITKDPDENRMEICRNWLNMFGRLLINWHKFQ